MPFPGTGNNEDIIRRAMAGEDMMGEELYENIRKAARGEIDASEVYDRPKGVTEFEEPIDNKLRKEAGMGPSVNRREKQIQVNVHIMPSTRETLRTLAEIHGYWHDGQGNVSKLLDAIGTGVLIVVRPDVTKQEGQS